MSPERPDDPDAILAEVARLYRDLQTLPGDERDLYRSLHRLSPAYWALETQIRALADRYAALVAEAS
jgi:hypothetical protein